MDFKLTENEWKLINAYQHNDYVSGDGWDNPYSAAWVEDFAFSCGEWGKFDVLKGKSLSGIISSLCKKGIMQTNGESFYLTEKGIEFLKAREKENEDHVDFYEAAEERRIRY